MSDKVFLDSNILVYAYSLSDFVKQQVARRIIANNESWISTQVVQETINVLNKKFKTPWAEIEKTIENITLNSTVYDNTLKTIIRGCKVSERYKFSFYDSLIIAAAAQTGCITLYSEDLNHEQIIDGVQIINPFL